MNISVEKCLVFLLFLHFVFLQSELKRIEEINVMILELNGMHAYTNLMYLLQGTITSLVESNVQLYTIR